MLKLLNPQMLRLKGDLITKVNDKRVQFRPELIYFLGESKGKEKVKLFIYREVPMEIKVLPINISEYYRKEKQEILETVCAANEMDA